MLPDSLAPQYNAVWLALLFPLLGAVVCGFFSRTLGRRLTGLVASGVMFLAFLASCVAMNQAPQLYAIAPFEWVWLSVPGMYVSASALTDGLTTIMLLVVTGVGFLIHCYSIGYMAEERDYGRFFTYLNLFVVAMVTLVIAGSLPMLLIGWGGVGFASYALIGFYYERPSAVKAARKAFVINLVGDLGLMLAIFAIAATNNQGDLSLAPDNLAAVVTNAGVMLPIIAVLLLVAAYAKSAQLPLHTWLPDAMEGPTPVSALIHAATMVTAGVYLVIRMSPIFEAVPQVQMAVALLGGLSALYAATCALTQTDLKRVLAYSTMSQLGYMFMAAGVGAYAAALFHLVTHAFFKALLFLTAGIVIHAMHDEQSMLRMGGLRRRMPAAYWCFLVGALAISGFPLLSGFFSKDEILLALYDAGGRGLGEAHVPLFGGLALWVVGVLTAMLTAFYMFRALFLTFHGLPRGHVEHLHAPGRSMLWPVTILAGLAIFGGVLNLPNDMTLGGFFPAMVIGNELEPIMSPAGAHAAEHHAPFVQSFLVPVLAMIVGIAAAFALVLKAAPPREGAESALARFLRSGWGIDAAFGYLSVAFHFAAGLLRGPFESFISRLVPEGLWGSVVESGRAVGMVQTGSVRGYALGLVLGMVVLLALALLVVKGGG